MNSVVIVAGGKGSRMNLGMNKQYAKINGKEIIAYTIEAFDKSPLVDEIVVVLPEKEIEFFKLNIIAKHKFIKAVTLTSGGAERQDSVYNGILAVDKSCQNILIHDGARPFVNETMIEDTLKSVDEVGAVVVGVPVKDTIKVVNEKNYIEDTPDRANLWAVQTPQVFKYKMILKAYRNAFEEDFYGTDDASLVERLGYKVKMIMGSYDNIKVTTIEDLDIGKQIAMKMFGDR